ncbi:MAG: polyhydroxybutyrate depolymerase [Pseudomonadota bacterium]
MKRLVIALLLALPAPAAAQGCGGHETPCEIATGSYHFARPEGAIKGTLLHLHGGGAKASGAIRGAIATRALARGYAVIAPQGWHPENRWQRDWSVRAKGTSHNRDDIAFLRAVLANVATVHGVAPKPLLLSGFSRGGSMVWDIACRAPDLADAFAPFAGAFWDDLPERCTGPVSLFHTHGWADRVVPLEGRSFRDGAVIQGDVWASLALLRRTNGCPNRQPETGFAADGIWLRNWSDCAAGRIDLMLHPGGHGAPAGWTDMALDWFEARLAERAPKG